MKRSRPHLNSKREPAKVLPTELRRSKRACYRFRRRLLTEGLVNNNGKVYCRERLGVTMCLAAPF
jgi:hypothetical protein